MIKCITHKKVFPSIAIAEDALIDSWSKFNYAPGKGPVAIYRCDDCGYYHFTSQGAMNEKLKTHIRSGSIKLQKEANAWMDKLKKK
jgi:hypothetical protein